MKGLLISATAVAVCAMSYGNAFASVEAIDYWSNSRWTVKAIPMRSKCIANASYGTRDGFNTLVGFQVFADGGTGFLIGSPKWNKRFHAGKQYWVDVQFDNYRSQRILATGFGDGGIGFEGITVDGITSFAKSTSFRLTYNGRDLGTYNLPGSFDAVVKTLSCVKDWNNATSAPAAPPLQVLQTQQAPGIGQ